MSRGPDALGALPLPLLMPRVRVPQGSTALASLCACLPTDRAGVCGSGGQSWALATENSDLFLDCSVQLDSYLAGGFFLFVFCLLLSKPNDKCPSD